MPDGEPKMTPEQMLEEQEKTLASKEKIKDKDLIEALKAVQMAEKEEEEDLYRKAIQESQKLEQVQKQKTQALEDEEEEMMR